MLPHICNSTMLLATQSYYIIQHFYDSNVLLCNSTMFIHSFIHSDHFYSTSSSPLLLRSAPYTAQILCQSFTPKHHRHLQVKDLPKVPMWWLERDSNLRPSG